MVATRLDFSFMLVLLCYLKFRPVFSGQILWRKEMLIIGLFIIFLSSILFSLIKVASPPSLGGCSFLQSYRRGPS